MIHEQSASGEIREAKPLSIHKIIAREAEKRGKRRRQLGLGAT